MHFGCWDGDLPPRWGEVRASDWDQARSVAVRRGRSDVTALEVVPLGLGSDSGLGLGSDPGLGLGLWLG